MQTQGISILYKKPQKKPPNLFSFLSPFSVEVWIYMCTAYLAVSLAITAMSRYFEYPKLFLIDLDSSLIIP